MCSDQSQRPTVAQVNKRFEGVKDIWSYLSSVTQPSSRDNAFSAGEGDRLNDIPAVGLLSSPETPDAWKLPTREVCEQPVLVGRYGEDCGGFIRSGRSGNDNRGLKLELS